MNSEHVQVYVSSINNGRFNLSEMMKILLKLGKHWKIGRAIIRKIEWNKLNASEMKQAFKESGNDWRVAQAIIKTGKLDISETKKVLKESSNPWRVALAIYPKKIINLRYKETGN